MPLFIKTMLMIWSAILGILLGITHYPVTTFGFEKTVEIGRGNVLSMAWSADSERLLVNTNVGAWIYTDTLDDLAHLDQLFHANFSPDGQWLAGGDAENRVSLRDAESYVEKAKFFGHHAAIVQVAWHPTEANWLASVDESGRVMVWDVATGREVFNENHLSSAYKLAWNPSGTHLALMGEFGEMVVWDVTNGQVKLDLPDFFSDWTIDFKWVDEQVLLRSWSGDGGLREAWNVETGQPLNVADFSLLGLRFEIGQRYLSPDGRYVASGGRVEDYQYIADIQILDAKTNDVLISTPPHFQWFGGLVWSPDSRKLASHGIYGDLKILNTENPTQIAANNQHALMAGSLAWRNDNRMIATASYGNDAFVWDANTGDLVAKLEGHQAQASIIEWQPKGVLLASAGRDSRSIMGGQDNRVYIWNSLYFDGTKASPVHILGVEGHVVSLAWHPNGTQLAITTDISLLYIWDLASDEMLEFSLSQMTGWCCSYMLPVSWSSTGDFIAIETHSINTSLMLLDMTTYKPDLPSSLFGDYHWSAENKILRADWGYYPHGPRYGNAVHIRERYENNTSIFSFSMAGDVTGAYFSENAQYLATHDSLGNLSIWDLEDGTLHLSVFSEVYQSRSLVWHPNERLLVLASEKGDVSVWDVELGKRITTLKDIQYGYLPSSLVWSHDGRRLATISDNLLRIWDMDSACQSPALLAYFIKDKDLCGK